MKRLFTVVAIFALLTGIITDCKKDKGNPPDLPPAGAMLIDFSNFTSSKNSASFNVEEKGTENSNWEFAAEVAGFWNLIITTTLAVPVTAFRLAIDQDPHYVSDKLWQWSYDITVLSTTYKVRLTGQIRSSDILWKMYVTKEGSGGFTDFQWFEGTSKTDGTGGQWTLYQSPEIQSALLRIDWIKDGSLVSRVKYTYLKDDLYASNYIEYGLTSGTSYDAYYTALYGFDNYSVNIEWNTTSKNGRVQSPNYLDGDWHCWNANLINDFCPTK